MPYVDLQGAPGTNYCLMMVSRGQIIFWCMQTSKIDPIGLTSSNYSRLGHRRVVTTL